MNRILKARLIIVLFIITLCCGCKINEDSSYALHLEKVSQMEQTAGNTYISGVRTGISRTGLVWSNHAFECTDDGVYFLSHLIPCIYDDETLDVGTSTFLFFAPHNSDSMIKLCGRPDCTHDTVDCNACFRDAAGGVTYYNGYLYIPVYQWNGSEIFDLYRINLDGTNRIKVGSFGDRSKYHGASQVLIIDGVFTFNLSRIDEDSGLNIADRFFYALDGSMTEPSLATNSFSHLNQESMDVRIVQKNGKLSYMIYSVDFRDDDWELVYVTAFSGQGYWGKDTGYLLSDNAVIKVSYKDGHEEVLFETGLEGSYHPRFFPDCVILTQTEDAEGNLPEIPMLYFYSWEGELLGKLAVDFPYTVPSVEALINGETKDQIYLWTSLESGTLPEYYINKSDFGTGRIELHRVQYPDFDSQTMRLLFAGWE